MWWLRESQGCNSSSVVSNFGRYKGLGMTMPPNEPREELSAHGTIIIGSALFQAQLPHRLLEAVIWRLLSY